MEEETYLSLIVDTFPHPHRPSAAWGRLSGSVADGIGPGLEKRRNMKRSAVQGVASAVLPCELHVVIRQLYSVVTAGSTKTAGSMQEEYVIGGWLTAVVEWLGRETWRETGSFP